MENEVILLTLVAEMIPLVPLLAIVFLWVFDCKGKIIYKEILMPQVVLYS